MCRRPPQYPDTVDRTPAPFIRCSNAGSQQSTNTAKILTSFFFKLTEMTAKPIFQGPGNAPGNAEDSEETSDGADGDGDGMLPYTLFPCVLLVLLSLTLAPWASRFSRGQRP